MRILLAEDDVSQAESIKSWLEMDGYSVDWVERGDHAILALEQHQYDCLLLDRGLPKSSGDEILKALRAKQSDAPVIFITARDSITDRVDGLDLGANDYLVKPFSLEELSARVRSQLRQKQTVISHQIEYANLVLDTQAKTVLMDGQVVNLTAKEFDVLELLVFNPNKVYSRENLLNIVWGYEDPGDVRTVDVHIRRLREKIEANPSEPKYVHTKWGVGYYFQA